MKLTLIQQPQPRPTLEIAEAGLIEFVQDHLKRDFGNVPVARKQGAVKRLPG